MGGARKGDGGRSPCRRSRRPFRVRVDLEKDKRTSTQWARLLGGGLEVGCAVAVPALPHALAPMSWPAEVTHTAAGQSSPVQTSVGREIGAGGCHLHCGCWKIKFLGC